MYVPIQDLHYPTEYTPIVVNIIASKYVLLFLLPSIGKDNSTALVVLLQLTCKMKDYTLYQPLHRPSI